MEIVIDKILIRKYFNLLNPKAKSESESNLISAIQESKNKFKFSESHLDDAEAYFKTKATSQELIYFQDFISHLIDSRRISAVPQPSDEVDEVGELMHCYNSNLIDYTFILVHEKPKCLDKKHFLAFSIYSDITKPNKDWLILNLLSGQICNVDFSCFRTRRELEEFFQNIPLLSSKTEELHVIDSYFNLHSNTILNQLKGSKPKIKCYTRAGANSTDNSIRRNSIKDFFGKRKTSVRFSKDGKIVHERKIIISDLILEATHDFAEIRLENKNWNLYITIDPLKRQLCLANLDRYNS